MMFTISGESDKAAVKSYIDRLRQDKRYTVEISLKKERRSLDQNRLYWLWINCMEAETGNDKEVLHHAMRMMFLPRKMGNVGGQTVEIPSSTTALDTGAMKQFLDKIQVFAASELGIHLPDPEDLIWGAFYEMYGNRI